MSPSRSSTSVGKLEPTMRRGRLGLSAGAGPGHALGDRARLRVPDSAGVPDDRERRFFSTRSSSDRPAFDFVELYIPSNPFNSLANNVVPAVVLFSVVVGVALIGVERKQTLLDVLARGSASASHARRSFIVRLTPLRPFCDRGRPRPARCSLEQLGRLQVYLVTYVARCAAAAASGSCRVSSLR